MTDLAFLAERLARARSVVGTALFLDALHIEPASTEPASSAGQPGARREEIV
jgi:hypothetical protein